METNLSMEVASKPEPEIHESDSDSDDESKGNKNKKYKINWKEMGNSIGRSIKEFFKKDQTKILLKRFSDYEGTLQYSLDNLLSTKAEKSYWCQMWLQIDEDQNNKMSYTEFCNFFSIEPDEYANRVFLIMNTSLTGVVNLAEFLTFCYVYLIVDKKMTQQFAFRMLSRKSATDLTINSVVGIEDIRCFIAARYPSKTATNTSRFAFKVFCYMDSDGDGGLTLQEWYKFCDENSIIVGVFHKFLMHLRKCVMGLPFWVLKSRKIKKKNAKGLRRLTRTSKINEESEAYSGLLGDPVVDKNGRPISVKSVVASENISNDITTNTNANTNSNVNSDNQSINPVAGSSITDNLKHQSQNAEDKIKKPDINNGDDDDDENDLPKDPKSTLFFRESFGMKKIPKANKKIDFAKVVEIRKKEKIKKQKANEKLDNVADKFAGKTYDIMVNACADLLYGRKGTRMAFNKWLDVVGLESTIEKKRKVLDAVKPGVLSITCIRGKGIKAGATMFAKLDSFVMLTLGKQEIQTEPCIKGGKDPVWNQEVVFQVKKEKEIKIQVLDDLTNMGECRVPINDWIKEGKFQGELNLFAHKGDLSKPVGIIELSVKYKDKSHEEQLKERLQTKSGISSVVDKIMSEEDVDDLNNLEEINDDNSKPEKKSGQDEEIYKKIMETTTNLVTNRLETCFEEYRKNYLSEHSNLIMSSNRTSNIEKLQSISIK